MNIKLKPIKPQLYQICGNYWGCSSSDNYYTAYGSTAEIAYTIWKATQ